MGHFENSEVQKTDLKKQGLGLWAPINISMNVVFKIHVLMFKVLMRNCIFICFYCEFLFYVQIPENNEEFRVTLTSATQGARVTDQEMILIIQANDAPIRFQQVT